MVYGTYNYSYWAYKPTYNWGGHIVWINQSINQSMRKDICELQIILVLLCTIVGGQ